jgi:trigger factor
VFAVTVKEIAAPGDAVIDDEFAKSLGLESLDKLKEAVKEQIGREDNAASRRKVKRVLLDRLDEAYTFDLPPSLVEQEFAIIWQNIQSDMERAGRTFADEGTTEEAAKADYQKIANRRVRLGLLLAEIGEKNQVQVTDEEVNRALIERVRQFPGQERQVFEFYRKNQQAMAELRAPLFEEKVVDYILELATVSEKEVSREALFKEEDEADAPAEAKTEEKPKKKATKKAAAEPASE